MHKWLAGPVPSHQLWGSTQKLKSPGLLLDREPWFEGDRPAGRGEAPLTPNPRTITRNNLNIIVYATGVWTRLGPEIDRNQVWNPVVVPNHPETAFLRRRASQVAGKKTGFGRLSLGRPSRQGKVFNIAKFIMAVPTRSNNLPTVVLLLYRPARLSPNRGKFATRWVQPALRLQMRFRKFTSPSPPLLALCDGLQGGLEASIGTITNSAVPRKKVQGSLDAVPRRYSPKLKGTERATPDCN